jgi:chromatin remodeling complex protein RSC6
MPAGKGTKTESKGKATTKTTKTTKTAKAVDAAPAPVEAAAEAPEVTSENEAWSAADELEALIAEVTALKAATGVALNKLKEFSKRNAKEHKRLSKLQAKKKTSSGPRKPSGFTKPTPITPELATFIGKPAGTEMARTDVTKEITAYVRAHNLQDKENGRKIIPDKKLSALLNVPKGTDLTYFNLQTYLSPHFVKAQASA